MVRIYDSPSFSLNFLICTSIVLSPTIVSSPQTVVSICYRVNTFPGLDASSSISSNSFLGN